MSCYRINLLRATGMLIMQACASIGTDLSFSVTFYVSIALELTRGVAALWRLLGQ